MPRSGAGAFFGRLRWIPPQPFFAQPARIDGIALGLSLPWMVILRGLVSFVNRGSLALCIPRTRRKRATAALKARDLGSRRTRTTFEDSLVELHAPDATQTGNKEQLAGL